VIDGNETEKKERIIVLFCYFCSRHDDVVMVSSLVVFSLLTSSFHCYVIFSLYGTIALKERKFSMRVKRD